MNDKKARYLIIDANNLTKQLYGVTREFSFNDWVNEYEKEDIITAGEVFNKNNIPVKYQKIILKISSPLFLKKQTSEYITDFTFDFQMVNIKKYGDKKYIKMHNSPIYYDDNWFMDKYVLETELKYYSFEDVINFLNEMNKNGYLEVYLESIQEIFDSSIHLDNLPEYHHQKRISLNKDKIL